MTVGEGGEGQAGAPSGGVFSESAERKIALYSPPYAPPKCDAPHLGRCWENRALRLRFFSFVVRSRLRRDGLYCRLEGAGLYSIALLPLKRLVKLIVLVIFFFK